MLTTVEGIYKDGHVELAEKPDDITEGKVLVTFLPSAGGHASEAPPRPGKMMYRGMFPQLLGLTDEDFKAAEFHGDPDDGLDWS